MGLELQHCPPEIVAPVVDVVVCGRDRRGDILGMKASLVEMFGTAALSVACSQPGGSDVAGASGIHWQEIVEALREN